MTVQGVERRTIFGDDRERARFGERVGDEPEGHRSFSGHGHRLGSLPAVEASAGADGA